MSAFHVYSNLKTFNLENLLTNNGSFVSHTLKLDALYNFQEIWEIEWRKILVSH